MILFLKNLYCIYRENFFSFSEFSTFLLFLNYFFFPLFQIGRKKQGKVGDDVERGDGPGEVLDCAGLVQEAQEQI